MCQKRPSMCQKRPSMCQKRPSMCQKRPSMCHHRALHACMCPTFIISFYKNGVCVRVYIHDVRRYHHHMMCDDIIEPCNTHTNNTCVYMRVDTHTQYTRIHTYIHMCVHAGRHTHTTHTYIHSVCVHCCKHRKLTHTRTQWISLCGQFRQPKSQALSTQPPGHGELAPPTNTQNTLQPSFFSRAPSPQNLNPETRTRALLLPPN